MEDRSSRNRHGQTGLTYTVVPTAPHGLPGRETPAGKAPQTVCFTRILWIQTLAACCLFLVLGGIRLFSPNTFTQIRTGLSGETLLGEDMGTLCSQAVDYMRSSEVFSALFSPQESAPESSLPTSGEPTDPDAAVFRNLSQNRGMIFLPLSKLSVTSSFGSRLDPFTGEESFHSGVDFEASEGTPVFAFQGGVVAEVGEDPIGGRTVRISHKDGLVSCYAHLSRVLVRKGDSVSGGQKIALSGSSGQTTGPHLHFALFRDGVAIAPSAYFHDEAAAH